MTSTGVQAEKSPLARQAPLAAHTDKSLAAALEGAGFPRYRAGQVFNWFYKRRVRSFAEMTNIPAALRAHLERNFLPLSSGLAAVHTAGDGASKLDIELADGLAVEAVLIETLHRRTLCLSCQVGCPLGCVFCATGQSGFERNLDAHEIVEQALHAESLLPSEKRISNAVFMGMGEPCLNVDAVFEAARVLNAPHAFGIGARRITISTLGDPACIERIAAFGLEVGLAVSLHAADDDLRGRLLPRAGATAAETVKAAWRYFEKTGREVTYEYVLLAGVNDSASAATRLAGLLKGRRAFVNLIPYNEVDGLAFRRPAARKVEAFMRSLVSHGVKARMRDSRGRKAGAACGQLLLEKTIRSAS